jgi:3-oxoacyl-[acyl-carrier protein] reductase
MNLKNKVVLITGASKGIGRSTAVAFAREGSSVIIIYKSDEESAQSVLDECNKYSKGNLIVKANLSEEQDVKEMLNDIKGKFSKIDVLVNNVGIFDETDSSSNISAFDNIYKNNFLSHILVTKYTKSLMDSGKIIFVSSLHGRLGYGKPDAIAYSAFKAALESYTKNLAKELAPEILVNAVAPGRVATSMWDNPDEKRQKELGKTHLIKRMIQPEEIAESIVFLAKNDAVCGEVLTVDGGMSLNNLND